MSEKIPYKDLILWKALSETCKPLRGKEVFIPEDYEEKPSVKFVIKRDVSVKKEIPAVADFQTDKRVLKKIKKGKVFIDAKLDLHGMTQAEAYVALRNFIYSASSRGRRYTLIITGKGSGILQTALPRWLELAEIKPYVSWFQVADIQHGGSGAFYVVLRKYK